MVNPVKIAVRGDIRGLERVSEITQKLENACLSSNGNVEVDLSGLTSIDYDGIVALLTIRNRQEGNSLKLIGIPDHIQRIIDTFKIPIQQ